MERLLSLILILFTFSCTAQKVRNYPKYTLSEIYKMINNEESDTFKLSKANIILDTINDRNYLLRKYSFDSIVPFLTDSIEIFKTVVFENVYSQFADSDDKYAVAFNKVIFHRPVTIKNSALWLHYNEFRSTVSVQFDDDLYQAFADNFENENVQAQVSFRKNSFEYDPIVQTISEREERLPAAYSVYESVFKGKDKTRSIRWVLDGLSGVTIKGNMFLGSNTNSITFGNAYTNVVENNFGRRVLRLNIRDADVEEFIFQENGIDTTFFLVLPESIQNLQMEWTQFSSHVGSIESYKNYVLSMASVNSFGEFDRALQNEKFIRNYLDSARIVNRRFYKSEIALIGTLNSIYKKQHDLESANASYIALKDLETQRLEYLYREHPSFDTYFEWKVNQFLKVFSDYGTRPAKAIVVSVYVILLFAFIYLLFPNSWDRHGKYRLIDRYNFFFKYMKRKAGIQEVYLEDQQGDLMTYEQFKKNIFSARQQVPKFFTATAYPLYKWSISGTKLSAAILKRVDIMRGSWNELPKSKRMWKSFLLIGAFVVAIIYDLFIKMLNALMLSINTFTTLGFGEIPIKGLPRYLAIIQGFIGWFMLTIFSVSLISQLLN